MFKKVLTTALTLLLLTTQMGSTVFAKSQRDADSLAQVRADVERAGLGEKARVTVTMKDGTKRKGYVTERRNDEFVLRERKTDSPTVIHYADASRVHVDHGHSTARNTAIGVGVGAGAVILTLALIFASLND